MQDRLERKYQNNLSFTLEYEKMTRKSKPHKSPKAFLKGERELKYPNISHLLSKLHAIFSTMVEPTAKSRS